MQNHFSEEFMRLQRTLSLKLALIVWLIVGFIPVAFSAPNAQLKAIADQNRTHDVPLPDNLRDPICAVWPSAPGCDIMNCPPSCLSQPERSFKSIAPNVQKRANRAGLTIKTNGDRVSLKTDDGRRVVIQASVKTGAKRRNVSYDVRAGSRKFSWNVIYDPKKVTVTVPTKRDAKQFSKFIQTTSPDFVPELKRIASDNPPGTASMSPGTRDRVFCGTVGILTGSANPIAGAGIFALCEWFASNGLD